MVYPLPEILLLVLCATLGGAEDFVEVVRWGRSKLGFLRRFLPYERGIPSHATLCDVVSALDPELFRAGFGAWAEGLRDAEADIVAIDGKTSRRSHDRARGRGPLHLVSALASRQRLVLGQQATAEKSNEIEAMPLLLERLALSGALVTIDAMGATAKIARAVLDRGADYLLALKANQGHLFEEAELTFRDAVDIDCSETVDADHGRIETRRHAVSRKVSRRRAGQRPGIKQVDDGIWLVSFMHHDLGHIDLQQKTVQTIDNPFGTRLSPMSSTLCYPCLRAVQTFGWRKRWDSNPRNLSVRRFSRPVQ